MPYNVLLLNNISPAGTELLEKRGYLLGEKIENPDAILVRSAPLHDALLPRSLKCIARAGAGVNNIPVSLCSERGIVVFNTPGANANAVKELVVCGLLLCSRKVADGIFWAKGLSAGQPVGTLVEKEKARFTGPEIAGKTLGVVGLGAVGVMVANAALALDMDVIGYDPYISVDAAWGLSREVRRAGGLGDIYERCDYITVHVPLNDETRGMIGENAFKSMKPGVRLLNFARAELVDTAAVCRALACGRASAYVTDFPTEELLGVPGVILLPHLGASTPESEDNCARMAAEGIIDYLENGNIVHSVNLPDVYMKPEGAHRLGVVNRNVPGMIGHLSVFLAQEKVNIENMINRSKKEYAYTLIDTNSPVTGEMLSRMKAVPDILSVRAIK